MSDVGKNIKQLREERGYTQAQLASLTGIEEKYISALERNVRNPGKKIIAKLCEAFAVDEALIRFGEREPLEAKDKDLQELQQEIERVFELVGATDLASKHHFLAEMHRKIKALQEEGRKG